MFVTEQPQALPGTCLLCPGSVRERYIDTELQFEFHGAVYLCDQCVTQMGRYLGMLSQDQAENLVQDNVGKAEEIYELKRKVAGLEAAVRGLADAGFESVPQRGDPGVLIPPVSGQGDVTPTDAGESQDRADRLGEGEGTPVQSSDDEQLVGVRSDDTGDGSHFRLTI